MASMLTKLFLEIPGLIGFSIPYNPQRSLAERIRAGAYENEEELLEGLTEQTAPEPTETAEYHFLVLVPPRSKQILLVEQQRWMEEIGLRHAGLRKLLTLGARYPGLQKEYRIWALGSTYRVKEKEMDVFPILDCVNGRRRIVGGGTETTYPNFPNVAQENDLFLATLNPDAA